MTECYSPESHPMELGLAKRFHLWAAIHRGALLLSVLLGLSALGMFDVYGALPISTVHGTMTGRVPLGRRTGTGDRSWVTLDSGLFVQIVGPPYREGTRVVVQVSVSPILGRHVYAFDSFEARK